MASRSALYSRPFKFLIVGGPGSGKSTLIRKFVEGFSDENAYDQDAGEESREASGKVTCECTCNILTLKATVKHVCKSGSSVPMTENDIARRLWVKKTHSNRTSKYRRSITLTEKDKREIVWDEIFVYLQRPYRGVDGRRSCRSFSASTRTDITESGENENMKAESDGGTTKNTPKRSNRKPRSKRTAAANTKRDQSKRTSLLGRALREKFHSDVAGLEVEIWDLGGESMWHQWYKCSGADAVLLCVPLPSILRSESFEDSLLPENSHTGVELTDDLRNFIPTNFSCSSDKIPNSLAPPVVLVGTKSDLCGSRISHCSVFDETDVEDSIGLNLAKEVGCSDFVRCSGSRGWGISAIFETAIAISMTTDGEYRASNAKKVVESIPSDADSVMAQEVAQPTYFRVHSFQKDSKPPVIKISKSENVDRKEDESIPHEVLVVQKASTPKRPPQIYFPPPPEFSPPSTCPPSSRSSLICSEISSSLESITDLSQSSISHISQSSITTPNSYRESDRVRTTSGESLQHDQSKNLQTLTPPIPAPRRKRNKKNTSNQNSISSLENSPRARSTDTDLSSAPKLKAHSQSSLSSSSRLSRRERRESIFLKFIQT